jgi:hypothetical protein
LVMTKMNQGQPHPRTFPKCKTFFFVIMYGI